MSGAAGAPSITEGITERGSRSRLPLLPTLIVAIAAATMVALGFWQLQRRTEKEALLAQFAAAQATTKPVPWPATPAQQSNALYRHSRFACAQVLEMRAVAGQSQGGSSGWAHLARCRLASGGEAAVAMGWSNRPDAPDWRGGEVSGVVGSAGKGVRLVASPPVGGLEQLALPDPADVPNNHLAYAIQWFFFAATALVIYVLALRKRLRQP